MVTFPRLPQGTDDRAISISQAWFAPPESPKPGSSNTSPARAVGPWRFSPGMCTI